MPNGLYWYHSHRHTMTAQQTYYSLAGLLEIGRPDGNLPLVSQNHIPVRDTAIQYNYVFDRNGKGHQLNNYSWPQFVSTFKPPDGSQLADGTYRSSLAPVNIADTTMGAKYVTPWYQGPLSPQNNRGQTQSAIYLDNPNHHEENVSYAQIASFAPFAGPNPGVTVATSSTVYGADLLVAGMTPGGQEVRKYTLERPAPDAKTVAPKQIANLPVIPGLAAAAPLGGR